MLLLVVTETWESVVLEMNERQQVYKGNVEEN
jgi:hypothetical protein